MVDRAKVINAVGNALDYQFITYSWLDMIDDIPDLTLEEKEYAKTNLSYKLDILD